MSMIPSLPSVCRHLRPGVATLRRTAVGLELTSRGSLPGFGLAAPVMFLAWDSEWLNLVFGEAENNAPPVPVGPGAAPAGPVVAAGAGGGHPGELLRMRLVLQYASRSRHNQGQELYRRKRRSLARTYHTGSHSIDPSNLCLGVFFMAVMSFGVLPLLLSLADSPCPWACRRCLKTR